MKRMTSTLIVLAAGWMGSSAMAGEAQTSAQASNALLRNNGDASATARYEGRVGFARTSSQSGPVSTARGVAVGVDKDGLSLSVSGAVAPKLGPAVGTNFTLSIDRDGDIHKSRSTVVARGPLSREVQVGGEGSNGRNGGASSIAGGKTDRFGEVQADSRSTSEKAGKVIGRIIERKRND